MPTARAAASLGSPNGSLRGPAAAVPTARRTCGLK